MLRVPEQWRIKEGELASNKSYGCNGAFELPGIISGRRLFAIVSDQDGWDHVSVSGTRGLGRTFCPNWAEMAYVKSIFWEQEDCVMQLHVPASQHISNHDYTLHLWRPQHAEIPLPDPLMVGVKGVTSDEILAEVDKVGSTTFSVRKWLLGKAHGN